ncbi:MAG: hypothetical protein CVV64_10665 [Candidatus Wallbacteria bacterium HGW-Wallbacteria-1]|uniref:Uncharacterized protein n=1 Tax=Candidatus Wallbacteria bacterium HGW-Wallbacteria-1 TaxID=2013854 RepID=A0A2N1PPB6_9BACT|nr:MAG: hypothetical protein CVV64_10665 [Candidatus Wallbacteria bacterium HGW-Wallbacteria-1]
MNDNLDSTHGNEPTDIIETSDISKAAEIKTVSDTMNSSEIMNSPDIMNSTDNTPEIDEAESESGGYMEVLLVLVLLIIPVWGVANLLGLNDPDPSQIHVSGTPATVMAPNSSGTAEIQKNPIDIFLGDFSLSVQSYSQQEIMAIQITIDDKFTVTSDQEEILSPGASISILYNRLQDSFGNPFSMERQTPAKATVKYTEAGAGAKTIHIKFQ